MHPYSCSSSRHLAALPTIVRCHMHLPPSSCSWPGTALAPDTHPDRALPWTFVGTHPDQWVSGGLPPAGCTAPASWLGHAPAPPHPLACGPGESRTRHTPVSDCTTMSHSSQGDHTQAVVSSHAIQLPACMLPGMDKPVPAQESQQEAHRATSVSTPHCILWAGRETMSSKGGPQTCPRPLVQALQGSTKQGTSSFTLSPFMAPAALLGK